MKHGLSGLPAKPRENGLSQPSAWPRFYVIEVRELFYKTHFSITELMKKTAFFLSIVGSVSFAVTLLSGCGESDDSLVRLNTLQTDRQLTGLTAAELRTH